MAKIIELTCKNCGDLFNVKKGKEKLTCSSKCRWDLRKKKDQKFYIEKKCKNCGEIFKSKKKENKETCSYKCMGELKKRNNRETVNCVFCNGEFQRKKSSKKKLCSELCRKKWNQKPENKKKRLEKSKNAILLKYGVESSFSLPEVIEKSKKTKKDKGINTIHYALDAIDNKRKDDLIRRFEEIGYKIIEFKEREVKVKHPDGHVFIADRKLLVNRLNHNVELSTKLLPISAPKSTLELKISEHLKDYQIDHNTNNREVIDNNEIDIYMPKYKLGIELNGLYWHSEYYVSNDYHLIKQKKCENKNIILLQFFEDEIIEKLPIVKSMINSRLGLNQKIFGRKTEVREISSKVSKSFLNKNHIQGNVNASIRLGLFYNDELVSVMTFGKKRKIMGSINTNQEYEMYRFCNKLNTSIIGGASKLFKYFTNNFEFNEVTSYADKRYSNGNLYRVLGFEYVADTPPNYFYVINKKRVHRFNYRKNVLVSEGYDPSKTEKEIMIERKIPRIYDCGTLKFIYEKIKVC